MDIEGEGIDRDMCSNDGESELSHWYGNPNTDGNIIGAIVATVLIILVIVGVYFAVN